MNTFFPLGFTEALRALGYPRAISISSFQAPNFKLVADIMYWLTAEVLDCVDIPLDIDTPDNRVEFLQAIHEAILSRTGVNVSAKNLYKADGHAVREMNKVILLLYRAAMTVQPQSSVQNASVGAHLALTNHMDKLKRSKTMAASVAQCGEHLASLLASGKDVRLNRSVIPSHLHSHHCSNFLYSVFHFPHQYTPSYSHLQCPRRP